MNEFSKISGSTVNLNKSELIPLGHSKVEIYTHNFSPGIKITTDKFKLLGIIIATNGKQKDLIEENYYNKKKKNIRNYKILAKERFNSVWQTSNHQKFDHTTINLCTDYFTFARGTLFKCLSHRKPCKIQKKLTKLISVRKKSYTFSKYLMPSISAVIIKR